MKPFDVVLLQIAEADYFDGIVRYGERFEHSVDEALDLLSKFPELGPVFLRNHRRLIIRRINFAIYYTLVGQRLMVGGILHLRQNPKRIRERLKKLG